MVNILGKWASLSVAFWAAESLLPGVTVTGEASTYLLIAFIFGIVNVTAGTLYRLLTFPITILTLGLWSFVVNAFMLLATDSFLDALFVDGFWWALAGALVISFVSSVVNSVLSSVTK
jgi:putative membrane protein